MALSINELNILSRPMCIVTESSPIAPAKNKVVYAVFLNFIKGQPEAA